MEEMKVDFEYNDDEDILRVLRKDVEISESADFGNIFIDFSKDLKVAGLEILDASKILSFPKDFLSKVEDVDMKVYETTVGVNIVLVLSAHGATERVSLPVALRDSIEA